MDTLLQQFFVLVLAIVGVALASGGTRLLQLSMVRPTISSRSRFPGGGT